MAGVHSARGGVDGLAVDQSLQNRKLQIAAKEQDTAGQSRGQASEAAAGLALADSQRTARGHLPPVRTLSWLQRQTHQHPAAPDPPAAPVEREQQERAPTPHQAIRWDFVPAQRSHRKTSPQGRQAPQL